MRKQSEVRVGQREKRQLWIPGWGLCVGKIAVGEIGEGGGRAWVTGRRAVRRLVGTSEVRVGQREKRQLRWKIGCEGRIAGLRNAGLRGAGLRIGESHVESLA